MVWKGIYVPPHYAQTVVIQGWGLPVVSSLNYLFACLLHGELFSFLKSYSHAQSYLYTDYLSFLSTFKGRGGKGAFPLSQKIIGNLNDSSTFERFPYVMQTYIYLCSRQLNVADLTVIEVDRGYSWCFTFNCIFSHILKHTHAYILASKAPAQPIMHPYAHLYTRTF